MLDSCFPHGSLPFFFLSFFNLEGIQLQHLHPLYKYFDKWFLSCHAYPKQGHLSFWKATVYSPSDLSCSVSGWGQGWGVEEGAARPNAVQQAQNLKTGRKKERRKGRKTLHNSQSNCCLLGNEAAVWGPVLSILPRAGKAWTARGGGGRHFPPSGGILKKDLFSSHSSAPLSFPRVTQLQFTLCTPVYQVLGRAGHLSSKWVLECQPEDPQPRMVPHGARAPHESPPKEASFKELKLLLFLLLPSPFLLLLLHLLPVLVLGNPLFPAEGLGGLWGLWVCSDGSRSWRNKSSESCGGRRGWDLNGTGTQADSEEVPSPEVWEERRKLFPDHRPPPTCTACSWSHCGEGNVTQTLPSMDPFILQGCALVSTSSKKFP